MAAALHGSRQDTGSDGGTEHLTVASTAGTPRGTGYCPWVIKSYLCSWWYSGVKTGCTREMEEKTPACNSKEHIQ